MHKEPFKLRPRAVAIFLGIMAAMSVTSTTTVYADELPPLKALDRELELDRFAGDWYVIGSIPVKIPFFNDSEAHNYTERYEILSDNEIRMTCAFNVGSYSGERKVVSFKAFPKNAPLNTEWAVQFVWPFRATYMVIYLDDEYETVIVGVPNRRWAWIMKRDTEISEQRYAELLAVLDAAGFDASEVQRIQHGSGDETAISRAAGSPESSYARASAQ